MTCFRLLLSYAGISGKQEMNWCLETAVKIRLMFGMSQIKKLLNFFHHRFTPPYNQKFPIMKTHLGLSLLQVRSRLIVMLHIVTKQKKRALLRLFVIVQATSWEVHLKLSLLALHRPQKPLHAVLTFLLLLGKAKRM
ncbi:hypothetical protein V6N13_039632 [Hibiscus sabdariffa]